MSTTTIQVTIYFDATLCLRAREWAKAQGMMVVAATCIWTGNVGDVEQISALAKEMGLTYEVMMDAKTGACVVDQYGTLIVR